MPADDARYKVHFGLDLTYACNYDCPYCELPPAARRRPVAEWVRAFERVRRECGRCYIYMSGGEPSVFPGFYDLVKALIPMHTVDLCTNLSWDVELLVPELDPESFRISPTFHPSQVDFEDFLAKAVAVKDYLPQRRPPLGSISFVADPRQMDRMSEYKVRLEEKGMLLVPLPLAAGKEMANTDKEKRAIEVLSPNKGTWDRKLDYQLNALSPKGRLCSAGQRYVHIRGDGMVDRCTRYDDRQIGDFFAEDFAVWEAPKTCLEQWCPFESQWIVQEPA